LVVRLVKQVVMYFRHPQHDKVLPELVPLACLLSVAHSSSGMGVAVSSSHQSSRDVDQSGCFLIRG